MDLCGWKYLPFSQHLQIQTCQLEPVKYVCVQCHTDKKNPQNSQGAGSYNTSFYFFTFFLNIHLNLSAIVVVTNLSSGLYEVAALLLLCKNSLNIVGMNTEKKTDTTTKIYSLQIST